MSMILPAMLTVTRFRAPGSAEPESPRETSALHALVADALLGDALLCLDDLGPGWAEHAAEGESLFAGTAYAGVAIADVRRSFVRQPDGARLEQQVAVLPRWTLRHLADECGDGVTGATPASVIQAATSARAVGARLFPQASARGTGGVVRHGAVVLALRFVAPAAEEVPGWILAVAGARCAEIAEALR